MRGAHPERAIEQHVLQGDALHSGERVVIACSGGPDSVALAGVLHAIAPQLGLVLSIAYVNHQTRASAWQDECIAMRVAATLGVPFDAASVEGGETSEAALRDARYEILTEIARQRDASAVATAHHAEDQTETVLLGLFRGSGPEGLAGMPQRRSLGAGVDLVRPLLRVAADDLRYYCHVNALPYGIDPTNEDARLRRNAVREALAALRPAFPGLDEAVARAAELVAAEQAGTPRAAMRRRVREVLREKASLSDVDFAHVEAAVRAMESGGSGRFLMKKGVTLQIDADRPRKER